MSIDFFSAFIVGLLGSGHCLAMCGGVSTMLTSAVANDKNKLPLVTSYNLGRIFSYSLVGAIAGFTGSLAVKSIGAPLASLRLLSGLFMILLGLYIARWSMILVYIEKLGGVLWRHISPLSKKLLPIKDKRHALLLGMLWGWLPCGLVYSSLTWAIAAGSAWQGALLMMCFGVGTLPALVIASTGYNSIMLLLTNKTIKMVTSSIIIVYGIYTVKIALGQFLL